ncbi:hypothetical protein BDV23DRAFT_154479 [Aspergillus alliaceus]|uniref:Uncharacterized protein n=1 Tax=Petromyces alliaceus TaxID=209559 RepID=A0A5N7C9M2_PETAA|nr:hypothetical protein BDV23DRAFT_154479 [Aspergillus alliaceus]
MPCVILAHSVSSAFTSISLIHDPVEAQVKTRYILDLRLRRPSCMHAYDSHLRGQRTFKTPSVQGRGKGNRITGHTLPPFRTSFV